MHVPAIVAGCMVFSLCAASAQGLRNGGFEEVSGGGAVQGWQAYGSFVCDTEQAHGGTRSIRCEVPPGGGNDRGGVMQEIVYDRPDKTPVVFGGWSRAEGVMAAGEHEVVWNAAGFPSGVYFCRMKTGTTEKTIKMTLVK